MAEFRDIFKVSRKTFFNPSGWFDWDTAKVQNNTLWGILKGLFTVPKPLVEETFEQSMERVGISEADLKEAIKRYGAYALLFCICGLLTFLYSFYLLFLYKEFAGFMLGISVSGLFFSQAFKFDFWSLQIKRRKLGLTLAEWKDHILGGSKGSST